MLSRRTKVMLTALALVSLVAAPFSPAAFAQADDDSAQVILDWNVNALDVIDAFPTTTNVLMGMVHGAVYDAVVSIAGGYEPYLGLIEADPEASMAAAAAAAAHGVLAGLYPDRAGDLQVMLDASLATVADGPSRDAGVATGQAAAAAMLAAREGDGRGEPYPLEYGDGPGEYRPTPPDFEEFPDAGIANVRMLLADDASYYRTAGPLALDSPEYAAELEEVRTIGGSGPLTDEQQAMMGFWFGPIPQWAQVERSLAVAQGLGIVDAARLFAIANLAAGDASIACHEDKYHWMFWRPVTAIHEAASDGNDATEGDPDWTPRGEWTPPYPDHPSGWNCYAGAHVGALQQFFGTDEMAYEITNPEIPEPRTYTSFSQGLQEGIELRILEGIHFRTADVQGAELGQKAAALAFERLSPVE